MYSCLSFTFYLFFSFGTNIAAQLSQLSHNASTLFRDKHMHVQYSTRRKAAIVVYEVDINYKTKKSLVDKCN